MIANTRYTSSPHFYLLLFLFILFASCKVQKPSSYNHLHIKVIKNGTETTKKVERTKVDSLDTEELEKVNQFLAKLNPDYPESKDFIFIKYYPGKDKCNSTGLMTRDEFGERDLFFQSEIQKRNNVAATWIYKDNDGINRYNKAVTYHPDQDHLIENTFFEYHYPCSSYVIIHKSGKYFAVFGESYYIQHIKDIDHFTYYIQNPNLRSPTTQK